MTALSHIFYDFFLLYWMSHLVFIASGSFDQFLNELHRALFWGFKSSIKIMKLATTLGAGHKVSPLCNVRGHKQNFKLEVSPWQTWLESQVYGIFRLCLMESITGIQTEHMELLLLRCCSSRLWHSAY